MYDSTYSNALIYILMKTITNFTTIYLHLNEKDLLEVVILEYGVIILILNIDLMGKNVISINGGITIKRC